MSVKLPNEHHLEFLGFKVGYTGSSESTLVKMRHCWKSHATAHVQVQSGGTGAQTRHPWKITNLRLPSQHSVSAVIGPPLNIIYMTFHWRANVGPQSLLGIGRTVDD